MYRALRFLPLNQKLKFLSIGEQRVCIPLVILGAAALLISQYIRVLRIAGATLILLGIAGFIALRLLRQKVLRRAQEIRKVGDVSLRQKLFEDKPHEFRVLADENVAGADYYFYHHTKQLLETLGFVYL